MKVQCTITNPTDVRRAGLFEAYNNLILAVDDLVDTKGSDQTLKIQAEVLRGVQWSLKGFGLPLIIQYTVVDTQSRILTQCEGLLLYVNGDKALTAPSLPSPPLACSRHQGIESLAHIIAGAVEQHKTHAEWAGITGRYVQSLINDPRLVTREEFEKD